MNKQETTIIFSIYNGVKDRYTKATTKEEKRARKEQAFILMHTMQNLHHNNDFRDLWDEYKATNDISIEKEWFKI